MCDGVASTLADEPFSDRPENTSPVIAAFLRTYNDGLDDERRQDLFTLASLIVGTTGGRAVERRPCEPLPASFAGASAMAPPAGRAAIGIATPEASGSWAALAALRTGPSAWVHFLMLEFARELVTVESRRRRALAPAAARPRSGAGRGGGARWGARSLAGKL